jgi:hypothetical protein
MRIDHYAREESCTYRGTGLERKSFTMIYGFPDTDLELIRGLAPYARKNRNRVCALLDQACEDALDNACSVFLMDRTWLRSSERSLELYTGRHWIRIVRFQQLVDAFTRNAS